MKELIFSFGQHNILVNPSCI